MDGAVYSRGTANKLLAAAQRLSALPNTLAQPPTLN